MKFFQKEYILNLPDCYNKEPTSNNYKMMQLLQYDAEKFQSVLQELEHTLSLDDATGYTLDLYGEMYKQPRGGMTDEQYRIAIRQKMAIYMCKSDYNSIVNVLSFVVGSPPESFLLEDTETGGNVDVKKFPYDNLLEAGITVPQAWEILESLLPAGVRSTGFNITQEAEAAELTLASALTFAETHVPEVACRFYETIGSKLISAASAVTHAENYIMEVFD